MSNFIKKGSATVLVDGQYGSTGKGMFAAYVGLTFERGDLDWATTNAGPNSGHTVHMGRSLTRVAYHLPWVAAIRGRRHCAKMYLNAGAVIDPDLLTQEVLNLNATPKLVWVHPHAAVVHDAHREAEKGTEYGPGRIASTQKGVGAAIAGKVFRDPEATAQFIYPRHEGMRKSCIINGASLNDELKQNKTVFVEVSQGFSLSINASGFYPHTTSRDCTVNQALSDANINPHWLGRVIMTMRTYPIRVGHIHGPGGEVISHSGGHYTDQKETTWDDIGVKPEFTTVTKRQRRVFTWSHQQCVEAFRANRPNDIFLNFCNYLKTKKQLQEIVDSIMEASHAAGTGTPRIFYGFGPRHLEHIITTNKEAMSRLK